MGLSTANVKAEDSNVSHLWDNKSPFSVLPRMSNAPRSQEHARSGSSGSAFPVGAIPAGGASKPRIRTVQEIEEEMRAAAKQRAHPIPQAPAVQAHEPVHQPLLTVEDVERQLAAHHISPHLAPASPQRLPQQPHQHHMQPVGMTRGHERQHSSPSLSEAHALQLLHAQQQQQLVAQAQAQALEQAYQQQILHQAKMQQVMPTATDFIQAQQLLEQQELLRQNTALQLMEREKLDTKRRRIALKLARMVILVDEVPGPSLIQLQSKNNDLMTQSDKDFITRIQVSQLMMADPYEEDFYNQVFQSLARQRVGEGQAGKGRNNGNQSGGRRRQNAMQRMEAQVERIINNVRLREKEKGLHCKDIVAKRDRLSPRHSHQSSTGRSWEDFRKKLQGGASPAASGWLLCGFAFGLCFRGSASK